MFTKILRFVVGPALAYSLIYVTLRSTGSDICGELIQARKTLLFLALLLYGGIIGLVIYRWNLLLGIAGVRLRPWDLVRLTMIGCFFNLAIPGAVSGDIVKMALVAKQTHNKKGHAILTIILDRILGLFGLFIVASVVMVFYVPFLLDLGVEYRPIQIAAFTVGVCSLGGVVGLAMVELRHTFTGKRPIALVIKFGRRRLPASVVSTLERVVNALELYRSNRRTIIFAIAISIIVHSCLAISLFLVGASVGENVLGLSDYFLTAQVANVVGAIPVTPGGIGSRDAITAMLFSAMRVPAGKAGLIPVTLTLIILFWGAIGGIIFIFSKSPKVAARGHITLNQEAATLRGLQIK